MGALVAATVLAVPGTSWAATGVPPAQPLVEDLHTNSRACAAGKDARAYVAAAPQLGAVLYDPDGGQVSGEFEVWWTDTGGAEQRRTYTTTPKLSGSPFALQLPADIPPDTVVSWHVRAKDGQTASPWSSAGEEGTACEFVYDDVSPEKATITSPDYPRSSDVFWVDGVGVYGHFTMDSPSDDVVAYVYDFIRGPHGTVQADQPGGAVTIPYLPLSSGPETLTVRAVDRAGRSSGQSTYDFNVKSGHAPVAQWELDDAAGSRSAAAESGTDARAGAGVTFGGEAPAGTGLTATAHLNGGHQAFLTPDAPAADTSKTFAFGAWVRPGRTDQDMAVLSQNTDGSTGVALALRSREAGPVWSFTVGGREVSGGVPETGEWAHVLGLYDAETGQAQLFVNGRATGTKVRTAPAQPSGAFRIGQAHGLRPWKGDIGDVRAYDRVVVPDEADRLGHRKPTLLGHWSLETASDAASPEQNGGQPLTLGGGAVIHRGPDGSCLPELDPDCPDVPYALQGDGDLRLDGRTAYAATRQPVVDTADSFTIAAVVRLADAEPDHPMTVLSQAGEHTDAFKVRYQPSRHAWQLVMPVKDETGAAETVVSQFEMADGGEGQGHRLAVVYDDAADTIRLYLDGMAGDAQTAGFANGWRSGGPLQVGRGLTADGWGEYLHGAVDEVQAYSGALRDRDITGLGFGTDPCLCS
ncbi:LamG domain-containing protein [Streptomyces sp. NPDC047869]|uniref:LamG domain-containing protein n=1 Tax=Streptomyces sp. NPDC047869 TaxID=3154709 RepID=UPI0034541F4F